MKPQHRVVRSWPLLVHITKNGRPVSETVGEQYVRREWPQVPAWKFERTDHSLIAEACTG